MLKNWYHWLIENGRPLEGRMKNPFVCWNKFHQIALNKDDQERKIWRNNLEALDRWTEVTILGFYTLQQNETNFNLSKILPPTRKKSRISLWKFITGKICHQIWWNTLTKLEKSNCDNIKIDSKLYEVYFWRYLSFKKCQQT